MDNKSYHLYDPDLFLDEYRTGLIDSDTGKQVFFRAISAVLHFEKVKVYDYEMSEILRSKSRIEDRDNRLYSAAKLNNAGIIAEQNDDIDTAISLYEQNILPNTWFTLHPYHRLCVLYRKRKDFSNEIRVIRSALSRFAENDTSKEKDFFLKRLTKAEEYNRNAKNRDSSDIN